MKATTIRRFFLILMAGCIGFFCWSEGQAGEQNEVLRSAGCKTAYFLIKDLADSFNEKGPGSVVPNKTGNKVAIKLLDAGKIHFAFTCKPLEALLKNIPVDKELSGHWTSRIIASDAIVVLVHRDNPVKSLSMEQIRNIFIGNVSNWKEVGGPDLKIQAAHLGLTVHSGVPTVFSELVLGKDKDGTPLALRKDAVKASGPKKLGAITAQNKGAVSFMGLVSYRERYGAMIGINDIVPSQENILNNNYPLMVTYYVIYDQRKSEETSSFLSFMKSEEGKNITNRNFIARPDK
jgi:phosphate transport system substrate-binding protein